MLPLEQMLVRKRGPRVDFLSCVHMMHSLDSRTCSLPVSEMYVRPCSLLALAIFFLCVLAVMQSFYEF